MLSSRWLQSDKPVDQLRGCVGAHSEISPVSEMLVFTLTHVMQCECSVMCALLHKYNQTMQQHGGVTLWMQFWSYRQAIRYKQ